MSEESAVVEHMSFGRKRRLSRLFRTDHRRILVVPIDHSVSQGVVAEGRPVNEIVDDVAAGGADAVVLHKGRFAALGPSALGIGAIVQLSASTSRSPDPDAKYLVTQVEESVRLGVDAVSVHVNLGSTTEAQQLADLGHVADACDRWNVPLMAMVYPRGPHVSEPAAPELVSHAVALANDLGADMVKTVLAAGDGSAMRDIVRQSAVPVLVAGGPPLAGTDEVLSYVDSAMASGAAGLAMGRNLFEAPDVAGLVSRVGRRLRGAGRTPVHGGSEAPLFDFHARMSPDTRSVERLLARMDENGIGQAAVCAGGVTDRTRIARQLVDGEYVTDHADNEFVLAACKSSGGRLLPFFFANPHASPDHYALHADHFHGVELSPAVHGVALDDSRVESIVDVAVRKAQPIYIVPTGQRGARVEDLVRLAGRHPDGTFVLGHCGFTAMDFHAIAEVSPMPNVLVESSGCYNSVLATAFSTLGAERVLFGTEHPLQDPAVEIAKFRSLTLLPDEYTLATTGNARRLLVAA